MIKYQQENDQLAKRLSELENIAGKNESEKEKMKGKLTESVRLLKELKMQKTQAEQQRAQYERELLRVQEEMHKKEADIQRAKEEAQKKIDELIASKKAIEESTIDQKL